MATGSTTSGAGRKCCPSKERLIERSTVLAVLLALVTFTAGVLIGHFAKSRTASCEQNVGLRVNDSISEKLVDAINASRIGENLRILSASPHTAGTAADDKLAAWIAETWRGYGLSNVKEYWYELLLSYPDRADPNTVSIVDSAGVIEFTSQLVELGLTKENTNSDVVPPFNAYSPRGDIQGDVIYVNYGRVEDFLVLERDYGVNFTGKIVLARYGKAYRGSKVTIAAKFGAAGMIFYSDPADVAPDPSQPVYPDSWWLPPTGVQRGSVLTDIGDPQTPGYPSLESAYRLPEEELNLPQIPSHPISYGDAFHILSRLKGPVAPPEWRAGLNITYRIGPGFTEDGTTVKLHVTSTNRIVNTSNVIGFIEGAVEPDRYVLLGNHHDAWGYGAVDPSSATAGMMEISRVMAELYKTGWRPRRTIIFCSWAAEEYGLMGSVEWVEAFSRQLGERAVAYINMDIAVVGNFSLMVASAPLLYDLVYNSAKKVETPNVAGMSLYDEWLAASPKVEEDGNRRPSILDLGAASDYAAFMAYAGIPSVDMYYWLDTAKYKIDFYPLYHSVYETFHAVDNYIDVGFKHCAAMAKFAGEIVRDLADSVILPFNVEVYGTTVHDRVGRLDKGYGELMRQQGISLEPLKSAARRFMDATKAFTSRLAQVDTDSVMSVRMVNDQMIQLERSFIDPAGIPGQPQARHVVFAPSIHDSYAGVAFPGLVDLMFDIENLPNSTKQWQEVKKHLSVVIFTIESATATLKPVIDI